MEEKGKILKSPIVTLDDRKQQPTFRPPDCTLKTAQLNRTQYPQVIWTVPSIGGRKQKLTISKNRQQKILSVQKSDLVMEIAYACQEQCSQEKRVASTGT